jgi:hypothetical protein
MGCLQKRVNKFAKKIREAEKLREKGEKSRGGDPELLPSEKAPHAWTGLNNLERAKLDELPRYERIVGKYRTRIDRLAARGAGCGFLSDSGGEEELQRDLDGVERAIRVVH